jgi:solute carrier family 25 carnitine/acylcarnitine transporter 20/29
MHSEPQMIPFTERKLNLGHGTKNFLAGGVTGICGTLLSHPTDTLVAWSQSPTSPYRASLLSGVKKEGMMALYKGVSVPLISVGGASALQFMIYEEAKQRTEKLVKENMAEVTSEQLSIVKGAIGGSIVGACLSILTVPKDLLQMKLQTSFTGEKLGGLTLLKRLYNQCGLKGLYRGLTVTCVRDSGGNFLSFGIYEYIKTKMLQNGHSMTVASILGGGISGTVFWGLLFPLNSIKVRVQMQCHKNPVYSGAIDCVKKTLQHEGTKPLYKGYTLFVFRSLPISAATFFVYETAKKALQGASLVK